MILAIDFDGTLSLGTWPDVGPANEKLFRFLKKRKDEGDKLILWSCRVGCKRQVLFLKKRHLFFLKCGKLFSRVCGILFS